MSVNVLPKTITKKELFEEAQVRFQSWVNMYADPSVSAQHMYEDMSCSCYCGCPADDFPDDVKAETEDVIKYQYDNDGGCFFMVDGIAVEVLDLRSMRESPRINKETYADICILAVSYTEEDDMYMCHIIPNAWLYGSTSDEFEKDKPVHEEFIKAAREYIKEHSITKEMQEVQ